MISIIVALISMQS